MQRDQPAGVWAQQLRCGVLRGGTAHRVQRRVEGGPAQAARLVAQRRIRVRHALSAQSSDACGAAWPRSRVHAAPPSARQLHRRAAHGTAGAQHQQRLALRAASARRQRRSARVAKTCRALRSAAHESSARHAVSAANGSAAASCACRDRVSGMRVRRQARTWREEHPGTRLVRPAWRRERDVVAARGHELGVGARLARGRQHAEDAVAGREARPRCAADTHYRARKLAPRHNGKQRAEQRARVARTHLASRISAPRERKERPCEAATHPAV